MIHIVVDVVVVTYLHSLTILETCSQSESILWYTLVQLMDPLHLRLLLVLKSDIDNKI